MEYDEEEDVRWKMADEKDFLLWTLLTDDDDQEKDESDSNDSWYGSHK